MKGRINPHNNAKVVYLLAVFAIILSLVFLRVYNTKVATNDIEESVIDTSYYNLQDHIEIVDVDSLLEQYSLMDIQNDSVFFTRDALTNEQRVFLQDQLQSKFPNGELKKNSWKKKTKFYFIHTTASKQNVGIDGNWLTWFFKTEPPKGRGWSRVGYVMAILEDGTRDTLVPFNLDGYTDSSEMTYGVRGVNLESLHFVWVGGLKGDDRTDAQKIALATLIQQIKCADPEGIILGHRDHPGVTKSCPQFDVKGEYKLNE